MVEKSYERYAWISLFAVAVIFALFGVGDLALGTASDPAIVEGIIGMTPEEIGATEPRVLVLIDQQVRASGAAFLILSLLAAAVAWTSYRGGEKWAWYALWTLPRLNVLIFRHHVHECGLLNGRPPSATPLGSRVPRSHLGRPLPADPTILLEDRVAASFPFRPPGLEPLRSQDHQDGATNHAEEEGHVPGGRVAVAEGFLSPVPCVPDDEESQGSQEGGSNAHETVERRDPENHDCHSERHGEPGVPPPSSG